MQGVHARIDALLPRYGVRKVETRGDCAICVTGTNFTPSDVADLCDDQVTRMLAFAGALGRGLQAGTPVRIGIATGPVILTYIAHDGDPLPTRYIFGETVNLAARMEQTGQVGAVQVAESAFVRYHRLEQGLRSVPPFLRMKEDIKGVGAVRTALYDYGTETWLRPSIECTNSAAALLSASL